MTFRNAIASALLALSLASAPCYAAPAANNSAVVHLEQAYRTAWQTLKTSYADAHHITDLDEWEHKFDGQLRTQPDLDRALSELLTHIGDKQVKLVTPSDVAQMQARQRDQKLGFGMHAVSTANPGTGGTTLSLQPDSFGPAQQAGILPDDVIESVNGVAADRLNADQVDAIAGSCKLGDTLRVKVTRRVPPFSVSCGTAPVTASESFSVQRKTLTAAKGPDIESVYVKARNLDDTRLRGVIRKALAVKDGDKQSFVFDLRGADGTTYERAAEIAALFMQQGMLACEAPDHREGRSCFVVDNKRAERIDFDAKFKLTAFKAHQGNIVVLVDDTTAGTALNLAAVLQAGGAKVITSGTKSRGFDDELANLPLSGDPASRSIQFPAHHITQTSNSGNALDADETVPTNEAAFAKAGELLGLKETLSESAFPQH